MIGGHLTPALAVIDELQKAKAEVFFIGRKFSMEGDKNPSVESTIIPKLGVPFFSLTAGRLQRKLTRYTLPSLLKIPLGFLQAYRHLKHIKPDVILSFGGYLAVPVVVVAKIQNIPVITHEQTVVSGLANQIISKFADIIALSWEQSLGQFPSEKVVLTGNPIRKELLSIRRRRSSFPKIYFTGGNQGAHIINEAVFPILPELLEMFEIFHQTGGVSKNKEDFSKAKIIKEELPNKLAKRYKVKQWFETKELVKIFGTSTLVVSRSGANIVTELASIGVPSILIPIPWVTQGEQIKNAQLLSNGGAAIILREEQLSSKRLFTTIQIAMEKIEELEANAKKLRKAFRNSAAEELADLVFQIGQNKSQKDQI